MHAGYDPSSAGERWNVNLPAVIGVVFVFLVGVVVWVVATSGDDGGEGEGAAPATVADDGGSSEPTSTATGTSADVTTPAPMPSITAQSTTPTTVAPATAAPTTTPPPTESTSVPTTAAGAVDDAVPGDLGVPGRPMQRPPCDGSYITVLASPIGAQANAASVASVLDDHPGSNYLRTDQTCPSLTPDVDGDPIYVIFFGPFAFDSDACAARSEGPEGAYARRLSDELGPDHSVACG
ncbi:MAG: hypothetical protein HKN41_12720 [Ilumatobacter sp.]|nr:hypothetical protein [Ilumatobacter sp.]